MRAIIAYLIAPKWRVLIKIFILIPNQDTLLYCQRHRPILQKEFLPRKQAVSNVLCSPQSLSMKDYEGKRWTETYCR